MRYTLLIFLTLFSSSIFAQNKDTWDAFWNKDTSLVGFKDQHGRIMIEPKFGRFTNVNRFDDIIGVTEIVDEDWNSYYLTKSGRIVGKDSLHISDNTIDCENEGFIRFRDRKTDRVGMFNKNGDVVIPAEYNEMTRVLNGFVIALKGAEKEIYEGGEHYGWKGGKVLLIDTTNKVIIDSFSLEENLNFYSLLISPKPHPDTIRKNYEAINGQYYSFLDYEKEFRLWLKTSLLNNLSKDNLNNNAYQEITSWKEPEGWKKEGKNSFIGKNYELIKGKLSPLALKETEYDIFNGGLNPYIYESENYNKYFNNCRESKDWLYPLMTVVINYKYRNKFVQDHFEFLRTDDGYKLISLSLKKGKIK